ncbi:MAG: hypothetical protein ACI9MR_000702 [Myxococcota bacterium]|jgi:uncharacterized protein YprB with RNaseH-like and TPR domain
MARWIRPLDPTEDDVATFDEALGGAEVEATEGGSAYVIDYRYPLDATHGALPLRTFFEAPTGHLAMLTADPRLTDFNPDRALFLDIETTGLDHGAGTLAFLIGLGFRDGDDFVVRQLQLREPSEERAQLSLLQEALDNADYLVSFNGKSFDLSVLQTRMVMHRLYTAQESELKLRPHLDLLHISKNLYRDLWSNTKLQTLEREALGFVRVDDIPGHLVPACWYAWMRHANPEPVAAVALHNLHDMLSMVTLGIRVVLDSLPVVDGDRLTLVALNLGRLLIRRGRLDQGLRILQEIPMRLLLPHECRETLWLQAVVARRQRDDVARRGHLVALLDHFPDDVPALIDFAIVTERAGNFADALAAAERAQARHRCGKIAKRITRLTERLARQSSDGCK